MERQGNSSLTSNKVGRALMIMLMGIFASSIFAVMFYLSYEVVVGSRDYDIRRTDIPGRAFDICYYVAGVCGSQTFPEYCRMICWEKLRALLISYQSLCKFFQNAYLFCTLSYMVNTVLRKGMDTLETPLFYKQYFRSPDRSPEASAVLLVAPMQRYPCGTPDINLHAEKSSCSSSASPLPQDGEFRDFPPATPGPSRVNVIFDKAPGGSSVHYPSTTKLPQDGEFRDFPPATPGPSWANVIFDKAPGGRSSVHSFNSPLAAPPASTEIHPTYKLDDDISLTEFDESESTGYSDQSLD